MAGAIDVAGNLEPACDSFRCAPYFFPHCTEDMGWCEVCDPEVSGHCTGFPEWNVFVDPYATAYLFTETSFPIAIVPLDVCDKLPIPGDFMDTLRAANSSECNQGIYEALLVSYDTFAAEQPFYRLWDSGAVLCGNHRVDLHAIDATAARRRGPSTPSTRTSDLLEP